MLHISGLSKQFGSKLLFDSAEVHIGHRSRAALIGPNGAGKSTMIKIIMGLESADSGTVVRANSLAIGYLPQEIPKMSGLTVLSETMRLDGRREQLLKTKEDFEKSFSDNPDVPEQDLERYGRIVEELEHLDEYRLESRAKAILSGMGFKTADFDRKLTEFSGGWLMRVALSRILLLDPDLLLLDEPTNHLDLESLLWLEEFLRRHQGALLMISHDTGFLNRIVNEVLEIDQKKVWSYRGNLQSYAIQKEERLQVLRGQYAGQQAKIAEIEAFVSRFGAKATKARQAQSKLKQLEKMDRIELPDEKPTVAFRFPPVPHSGKDVVIVKDASVQFGEKKLFRDLDWLIRKGTRTAIVGVNGAGKTTLLKMLAKTFEPTSGEIRLGHGVQVGYYSQMQAETLTMTNTIAQELEQTAPDMPISQVRAIAGAFLFSGDAVKKQCGVLSGGEKARVALAKLLLTPANFLVLDEPTNHLDVESRGVLLEALQDYDGTLCLVSHDRDFVSPLVDTVLEIEPGPDGSKVIHSTQTYDEYLARKIQEASGALSGIVETPENKKDLAKASAPEKNKSAMSPNLRRTLTKEKETLEKKIAEWEKEKTIVTEQLSDPVTYQDKKLFNEILAKQQVLEASLEKGYPRWEELSLLLET
ncbi:MAG: ABC-F family ATP-binding cassette domain-containing protein [Bdellovibrionota bacterium]